MFSVLRSKNLNLKYNTASMLEMESGSNDPFAYMLTVIVLSFMKGETCVRTDWFTVSRHKLFSAF